MLWVFDKFGERHECFRERFQMPYQYEKEEGDRRKEEEDRRKEEGNSVDDIPF
jgi:hypothetical protein